MFFALSGCCKALRCSEEAVEVGDARPLTESGARESLTDSECDDDCAPMGRCGSDASTSAPESEWRSEALGGDGPDVFQDAQGVEGPRGVQALTEEEVGEQYQLEGQVAQSCHRGTYLLFATRSSDGRPVVVKALSKVLTFNGSADKEAAWRGTMEAQLCVPKCESICELLEVLETHISYYVVMERCEGLDLWAWDQEGSFSHDCAREIMRQILEALRLLHDAGYVHRDIKADNVVVDVDPEGRGGPSSKLIDFDTVAARDVAGGATHVVGTDGYIAPEAYEGHYSPASDLYSAGVIMYTLLTRKPPTSPKIFDAAPGENLVGSSAVRRVQKRLKAARIDFSASPLDACSEAAELCRSLLAAEPGGRPSAEQALAHGWFSLAGGALPERRQEAPRPARAARFFGRR